MLNLFKKKTEKIIAPMSSEVVAISECGDPVKAGEPSIIEYNKK